MLDLNKLDKEVDFFIANQTTETYNELFNVLDEELIVKLSGGYTMEYDCPNNIAIDKPNAMVNENFDFSEPNYNIAA